MQRILTPPLTLNQGGGKPSECKTDVLKMQGVRKQFSLCCLSFANKFISTSEIKLTGNKSCIYSEVGDGYIL